MLTTTSVEHIGPVSEGGYSEVTLAIPSGAGDGEYFILAYHPASESAGWSNPFRIEPSGEGSGPEPTGSFGEGSGFAPTGIFGEGSGFEPTITESFGEGSGFEPWGVPATTMSDGVGVSVDVVSAGHLPGSEIDVRYDCHHCDCPRISTSGIFLRREGTWESRGLWLYLGMAEAGGPFTETFTIPSTAEPADDYVVTVWAGDECWGESSSFPIRDTMTGRPDFRVIRPNGGELWPIGSLQTIRWSFANLLSVPPSSPATAFDVELTREGGFAIDIPTTDASCDLDSATCSLPWIPSSDLEIGSGYKIRISFADASAPGGERHCESRDTFGLCEDCAFYYTEAATDVWVEWVDVHPTDGIADEHVEKRYFTDDRSTNLRYDVRVGYNGQPPPEGCELVVRSFRGDGYYASYSEGSSAVATRLVASGASARMIQVLPPGLTLGDTIPIRVELIIGHEDISPRVRMHLDLCESLTENNTYDFSVTLIEAGSTH
jgi:hypothetical protein